MADALKQIPGSIRALAQESGVSDALLRMIRDGERRATITVIEAVAGALERMAQSHARAAKVLRDSIRTEG